MAAYNKFNQTVGDIANGKHNFGSDSFKIMLTNSAPIAANAIKADITEITPASGYAAGGPAIATDSDTDTTGTVKFVASADNVITAGAALGPFRYVVLYNDTQTSPAKPLVAWWDYGSSISLAIGETFTFDIDQTNGIFTLT